MMKSRLLIAMYVCAFSLSLITMGGVLAMDKDNSGDEGIIGALNHPLATIFVIPA